MTPLRIGYHLTSRALGGMEQHVVTLIRRAQMDHHCIVFSDVVAGLDPLYREIQAAGATLRIRSVERAQSGGIARAALRSLPVILAARAELMAANLDVLHFHVGTLHLAYPAILASRIARIPRRVLTLHNLVGRGLRARRIMESLTLRTLHRIIAVSPELKENLVASKGVAPERICVIPNGVEVEEFRSGFKEESRQALEISCGARVVGMAARLHAQKGADLLIRAAPIIRSRVENLRIVLIGDGPERPALVRLARNQRVSDIVTFTGYRADARRLLCAFDIVVLPSRHEGLPFTLLEGMAGGKPVVAANVGGIPSVVVDGVTGLLFPSEDVAGLAAALIKLLDDPAVRQRMGDAGRERVKIHFSEQAMLERTLSVYGSAGDELSLSDGRRRDRT